MKKTRRTAQMGDVVRAELSEIIRRELSDPALSLVTITSVEMSTDMRLARVFVSAFGTRENIDAAVDVLQKAGSKIRYQLGQRASLRYTPELDFRPDTTGLQAQAIEGILKDVLPEGGEGNDEH